MSRISVLAMGLTAWTWGCWLPWAVAIEPLPVKNGSFGFSRPNRYWQPNASGQDSAFLNNNGEGTVEGLGGQPSGYTADSDGNACNCQNCCREMACRECCNFNSTCDMVQHHPYFPVLHGYYYFRPYHPVAVALHQDFVSTWNGDRRNPYSHQVFQEVYEDYRAAHGQRSAPDHSLPDAELVPSPIPGPVDAERANGPREESPAMLDPLPDAPKEVPAESK